MQRFQHKKPKQHKLQSNRCKPEPGHEYGTGPAAEPIPFEESKFATKGCSDATDYEFLDHIGAGAYAIVMKCRHKKTGNLLAAKIYDKFKLIDESRKKSLKAEIRLMKRI